MRLFGLTSLGEFTWGQVDLPDFFEPVVSGKMALLGKRRADEKEPI
jgi:hypothetical protein